jgi:uncharacterized damage-inducible protein DinB
MTLQEITILHAFNSWANQKIFDALAPLSVEQLEADMKASHRSLHGTLAHLLAAHSIWLSRWKGTPEEKLRDPGDFGSLADLKRFWEQIGYETARWLGTMSDRTLQETFTAAAPRGGTYRHTYWQAFQHVVDHSTYHRGQIITLLRQLGVTPPTTGLIAFYRETSKLK